MNTNKEKWADEVLENAASLSGAEPDPGFYDRLRRKMQDILPDKVVKPGWVAVVAACLALLLTFNIYTLGRDKQSGSGAAETSAAADLGSTSNYNLY